MNAARPCHPVPRRPPGLCRSPYQWACERDDAGVRYRLYAPAGEGMLDVRRLTFAPTASRAEVAAGLRTLRAAYRLPADRTPAPSVRLPVELQPEPPRPAPPVLPPPEPAAFMPAAGALQMSLL